jgi:hypothetical protein
MDYKSNSGQTFLRWRDSSKAWSASEGLCPTLKSAISKLRLYGLEKRIVELAGNQLDDLSPLPEHLQLGLPR